MAEEEENKASEGDENEEGKKPGKKKLIIIIAAIIALVVIGGGAFIFLGGSSEETPPAAEEVEKGAEGEAKPEGKTEDGGGQPIDTQKGEDEEKPDVDFGETFKLKAFNLNLGNPLENRYIRMEISLEYKGGEEQKAELEARLPQIRDAVVTVTSKKTREFLLGADGKDQLRLELQNYINQFMTRKIEAVYITDILIE